jgi:hypothetical protein
VGVVDRDKHSSLVQYKKCLIVQAIGWRKKEKNFFFVGKSKKKKKKGQKV